MAVLPVFQHFNSSESSKIWQCAIRGGVRRVSANHNVTVGSGATSIQKGHQRQQHEFESTIRLRFVWNRIENKSAIAAIIWPQKRPVKVLLALTHCGSKRLLERSPDCLARLHGVRQCKANHTALIKSPSKTLEHVVFSKHVIRVLRIRRTTSSLAGRTHTAFTSRPIWQCKILEKSRLTTLLSPDVLVYQKTFSLEFGDTKR